MAFFSFGVLEKIDVFGYSNCFFLVGAIPCGCPTLRLNRTLGDHKGTPLQEQPFDKEHPQFSP